jgi:hypothetical protein
VPKQRRDLASLRTREAGAGWGGGLWTAPTRMGARPARCAAGKPYLCLGVVPCEGGRRTGSGGGERCGTLREGGEGKETKRYMCNRWQLRVISGKTPLKVGESRGAGGFCNCTMGKLLLPLAFATAKPFGSASCFWTKPKPLEAEPKAP